MDGKIELAKVTISSTIAFWMTKAENNMELRLLFVLLLFMFVDTVMGWAKAIKNKSWKSTFARWGMLGKVFMLGLVAVAHSIDWAMSTNMVEIAFTAYFCLVEVGSMLENAYELGVPIPKQLAEIGKKAKYFVGWLITKKTQDTLSSVFKVEYKEIEKIAQEQEENTKDLEDKNADK